MAAFLYQLGRLAFRRRWTFAVLWVVVLAGVGVGASLAPAAPDSGFSMPGTESQKALTLIEERFPSAGADGASAQVVFVAPGGEKITEGKNRSAVDTFVSEIANGPQVASAASPFTAQAVSQDGTTTYVNVSYKVAAKDLTAASRKSLEDAVQHGRDAGVAVEVGGNALTTQPSVGGATEGIGLIAASLVLLVTFGSLAAAGMPLLNAILAVGISTAGIMALGSAFGLSTSTSALANMLGLAVGIDYAVLIISRYREERAKGHSPQESAGRALGTAGSAVVFAGLTVIIGLAGLAVVNIPALTKMGLSAAGAVAVAVLVSLTLVPALLGFWPHKTLARRVRKGTDKVEAKGSGGKANGGALWGRLVLRHPLPVLLLAVVGLGIMASPVLKLNLGTTGAESQPTSTTERRAYDDLAKAFGPGFNGPLTVVVDAKGTQNPQAGISKIADVLRATPGVVHVSPAHVDTAGDTAILSVVPSTSPTDTKTRSLIESIRSERTSITAGTGMDFSVTGSTAINIDSGQKVQGALVPYLSVVVSLAFVLLMVVFRSVLIPLKAAVGFLLSVLAALGAVVAVFQWGWGASLLGVHATGPIMSLMPIFMVGIVFGLAMDYQVFLVSRMRESYAHGEAPHDAIVSGLRTSARVVVAAALIMVSVFSGFIGAADPLIKLIGFGMATAVIFDAFVVRMAIVPATLVLLGRKAWWMPQWLDRFLPRVDIEGESLARRPSVEQKLVDVNSVH
ncbi:MMPL family transporter [Kitasatospora cineracea]|uniref:RND superfamily putative drug exporter n=1 Tax=Kitasatospora cineracea TaxID=88074 RepID=A0A8G1URL0_9ACTN|nr:MMPL family transporter [Kitasatospora cineracea]ROR46554.1 RND superfamily putative drug exporter [Kitasatospora cineracea]